MQTLKCIIVDYVHRRKYNIITNLQVYFQVYLFNSSMRITWKIPAFNDFRIIRYDLFFFFFSILFEVCRALQKPVFSVWIMIDRLQINFKEMYLRLCIRAHWLDSRIKEILHMLFVILIVALCQYKMLGM